MKNKVANIYIKIVDYFEKKKKWKIRLYFLNQLVCTKKINSIDDISEIFRTPQICKVHKKHLFNTYITQIVLIPTKGIFKDGDKKELHLYCEIYEGVTPNEIFD